VFGGYVDVHPRIERGEVDFAFATSATPLPAGAASADIAHDHLSLVMRAGHPRAGRAWTLSDYAGVDHVGVAIFGDGQTEIDAVLAAHGLTRRMAAVAPHFAAVLAIVAETDFVTTVSHGLAARFAPAFDLRLRPPPKEIPAALDLSIVWSRPRGADPLLAWVRDLIIMTAAQTLAPPRSRLPR
jgi:DNA-binding transcriptional LysR family regulator